MKAKPKTAKTKLLKTKASVLDAAEVSGLITVRPSTKSKVRLTVKNAVAVGNIIPINLKLGRDFGKSDEVIVTMECCGPYHQHCDSFAHPA
jgi:hypothetical protein